jgi:hypothetical protein
LRLSYVEALSNVAFNINLRRYVVAAAAERSGFTPEMAQTMAQMAQSRQWPGEGQAQSMIAAFQQVQQQQQQQVGRVRYCLPRHYRPSFLGLNGIR